jgi:hypothetical protein
MAAWNNPDFPSNGGNDWFKQMMMGSGFGQMAGGLAGLFGGGGRNPADAANKRLDNIPGQVSPYYQPYQQAGAGALSDLQNQYKDLLSGGVYNKLGEGYKESPGYQFKLKQALGAGGNAAAAGGMLGTPQHEQQSMQIGNDIASQDFNDYMQKQMGLYGLGLQGQQGINKMGYDANTGYGNMMGNIEGQKAAYDYAGQAGKNQQSQGNWANIFGGLGSLIPGLFGM